MVSLTNEEFLEEEAIRSEALKGVNRMPDMKKIILDGKRFEKEGADLLIYNSIAKEQKRRYPKNLRSKALY